MGYCTTLALETNGTLFDSKYLLVSMYYPKIFVINQKLEIEKTKQNNRNKI